MIVKTTIATGVQVLDLDRTTARQIVIFGAQDLIDDADVTVRPVRRGKSKTAAFISDFRDLAVGDYVVHVEHGIAHYCGLRVIEENDAPPLELMILEFADEAKLYVPLTRLDLIQKYRSTDTGPAPQLNKLGTQGWQKTKARVKKAMADMADELLKLYAQRESIQGTPFSPDTNMQREFEDAFDFNETDDQLTAIADIKRDMESTQPMDRLLCGDVGYGKTEVAMRAAFKAVQDSKQVAVLTPTTVLSFQHFETFKRRFANFPVNIEMISRFRTAKEQKEILEKVEQGKVDILIGTHRASLEGPEVSGPRPAGRRRRAALRRSPQGAAEADARRHRRAVDVGDADSAHAAHVADRAARHERDRDAAEGPHGDPDHRRQVRREADAHGDRDGAGARRARLTSSTIAWRSIYELAAKIRELVPQARVVIGHGQMPEAELERVMLAFMNHEYDVLLATSIIENGLDIPLANTIIINRADRHGLSELYQLRGRVGRIESPRLCVSADSAGDRADRDRAAPARGAEGVLRPRRGLQDRRARSRAARRGQHAGRRAVGPHRGHRLRDVHHDARRGRAQDEGRGRQACACQYGHQPRHQRAHRRGLYPRREPAAAHVQAHRRSAKTTPRSPTFAPSCRTATARRRRRC